MIIVIQRVTQAAVRVDGAITGAIDHGLMVLVGVEVGDSERDATWLAGKTAAMRIFDDADGVMNLPVTAVGGRVLAVSQFTLLASARKGNRPSYIRAERGDRARELYEKYCDSLTDSLLTAGYNPEKAKVERGVFGADMSVALTNDGPVTIILNSRDE